jgi:ribosomal protein S18 acetylase RimI-like enzyme
MKVVIKSIETRLLEDFLYFFDNKGFTDNPDWAKCYCHFYHFDGDNKGFAQQTSEDNREASKQMILSGIMNGYLAYLEDKPVGWCNANLKEKYSRLPIDEETNYSPEGKIASIVCFLIDPGYRRQGIARQLLNHVCIDFQKKGYDFIDAYPVKGASSEAHNYHGPFSMYASHGFATYKEFKDFYVVRKKLS